MSLWRLWGQTVLWMTNFPTGSCLQLVRGKVMGLLGHGATEVRQPGNVWQGWILQKDRQ